MPKLKLTRTAIEKLKPDPTRDTLYWDTGTRGLGLRVTKGGVFSFICQGRVRGTTKDVRLTIGTYGAWQLEDAQRKADYYRQLFEGGNDPRELKKQHEAEQVTLRQAMEAYVSRPGALKPGTAAEYRRTVERVLADWADRPITEITRSMVLERHQEIADHGLDGKRGAPASANSAMTVLRILANYVMDTYRRADGSPLLAENPVKVMKRHWRKEGSRKQRFIPDDRIGEVWLALDEARIAPKNGDALAGIDLVRLALLTGARKNELAALEWTRVNIDEAKPERSFFHLPNPKNGTEVFLPLSRQAVAILKERRKLMDGDYVFASRSKLGYITDTRSPLELVSKVAGKHLSLHDMRRSFTGIALRLCRIEKFRVDLLTNHQPPQSDTTIRNYFDTTNLQWLNGETQTISDYIEEQARIAAAKAASENVVDMQRA